MTGIGHNGGPSMEAGFGFRKHAWTRARAELLPTLPIEVLRVRVRRAERLGLPYRTYASFRARTGRDVVAFLFSDNALDLRPGRLACPPPVATRLTRLDRVAGRLAAVHPPTAPLRVVAANPGLIDGAGRAPGLMSGWSETREAVAGLVRRADLPCDGVVLIAATALEEDWATAARLAGVVRSEAFFGA